MQYSFLSRDILTFIAFSSICKSLFSDVCQHRMMSSLVIARKMRSSTGIFGDFNSPFNDDALLLNGGDCSTARISPRLKLRLPIIFGGGETFLVVKGMSPSSLYTTLLKEKSYINVMINNFI